MRTRHFASILIVVGVVLSACGPGAAPTPTAAPVPQATPTGAVATPTAASRVGVGVGEEAPPLQAVLMVKPKASPKGNTVFAAVLRKLMKNHFEKIGVVSLTFRAAVREVEQQIT